MEYTTINELVEIAKENGISVGEAVLKDQAAQMEQTEEHFLWRWLELHLGYRRMKSLMP